MERMGTTQTMLTTKLRFEKRSNGGFEFAAFAAQAVMFGCVAQDLTAVVAIKVIFGLVAVRGFLG